MDEGLDIKLKKAEELPEYIQMYEIYGRDPISAYSFKRYMRDKNKEEGKIKNFVGNVNLGNTKKGKKILEKNRIRLEWRDMIDNAKEEGKEIELIQQGLATGNIEIQRTCIEMVAHISTEKIFELIEHILATGNVKVQKICLGMMILLPPDKVELLEKKVFNIIEQGLANDNPEGQKACAEIILFAPKEKREILKEKVAKLIEQSFFTGNVNAQRIWVKMIESFILDEDKIAQLIEQGFMTGDIEVGKSCAELILHLVPENKKEDLFKLAKEKLGNALVEPTLYKKHNISSEKFSRSEFQKTGSETTLIGGNLKDKTIIRHIKPKAFLVWQKMYENHEMWKKAGFDYVPIEPIQSFRLNKDGLVDVYSGILDLKLANWKGLSKEFNEELETEKRRIMKVLSDSKIQHRSFDHDENFCLRFFRNTDGKVYLNKKPRIYLIDFDEATFI